MKKVDFKYSDVGGVNVAEVQDDTGKALDTIGEFYVSTSTNYTAMNRWGLTDYWSSFYIDNDNNIFVYDEDKPKAPENKAKDTPDNVIWGEIFAEKGKIGGVRFMQDQPAQLARIDTAFKKLALDRGDFFTKDNKKKKDDKGFRIFSIFDKKGLTLEEFSSTVTKEKLEMETAIEEGKAELILSYNTKEKKFAASNRKAPTGEAPFVIKKKQDKTYEFLYGASANGKNTLVQEGDGIHLRIEAHGGSAYDVKMRDLQHQISGVAKFDKDNKLTQMSFDIDTVADLTKINEILQEVLYDLDECPIKINTLDKEGKLQEYGKFTLEDLGILNADVTIKTCPPPGKEKLQGFKNPKKIISKSKRTQEQNIKKLIKGRINFEEEKINNEINNERQADNPKQKPLNYTIKCKDGKLDTIEFVLGKNEITDKKIIAAALQSLKDGKSVDLNNCTIHLKKPGLLRNKTHLKVSVNNFLKGAEENESQKSDPQITSTLEVRGVIHISGKIAKSDAHVLITGAPGTGKLEEIWGKHHSTSENEFIVVEEYDELQDQNNLSAISSDGKNEDPERKAGQPDSVVSNKQDTATSLIEAMKKKSSQQNSNEQIAPPATNLQKSQLKTVQNKLKRIFKRGGILE